VLCEFDDFMIDWFQAVTEIGENYDEEADEEDEEALEDGDEEEDDPVSCLSAHVDLHVLIMWSQ